MHFLAADGIIKAIVTKLCNFKKKKLCYNNKSKNKKQKEAFGA